jgi:hypothetical protein
MVAVAVAAGATTVSGLAGSLVADLDVEATDPIAVDGVDISFDTVENTTYSTPAAVRARVLDSSGAFVRHLDKLDGLRWLDEFNTAGAGSIDMLRYFNGTDTSASGVLSAGNQIMVSVGANDIFRIVLDSEPGYRVDEAGNRIDAWAGVGALGVLNSGMVIPEYGWRNEATDQRSFDYGSDPTKGGWLVASEWKTPVGKPVRSSWRWTYRKRHLPKGFPTRGAQWLWWRNPDSTASVDETCYFRSSFTLSQTRRVKFWVCGDDTLEFQVDGETRITTGPGGWKKTSTLVMTLSAGTHYVAAKVTNTPGSTGNQNRSGFLCAIGRLDGNGDVTKWLRTSNPSSWTVRRQRTSAPGWFVGQIIKQLVSEQIARGCAGHSGITYAFSTTADSANRAWIGRQEVQIPVETLGLDWIQQMVELGVDVAMSPALKLYVWRRRGADRSPTIRLGSGANTAPLDDSGSAEPSIRNVAYARSRTGWVGVTNSGSVASRGRREIGVSLGSARSSAQTAAQLNQMLPDLADPPQTFQLVISGASGGPQPYTHFNPGDWVSARPSGKTAWTRCRVLSIAGEVNPAGHPDWTISLVED